VIAHYFSIYPSAYPIGIQKLAAVDSLLVSTSVASALLEVLLTPLIESGMGFRDLRLEGSVAARMQRQNHS
jgi:hypothetical protein